ncbi:glycerophosphodiester phosphodiesterase [Actinomadura graeca]|uniref:Glycerophosphodiester phosphodiesterase n=1 Tax=Actinomadura graeca TaxID=2750812 RepID=A0ABX8R669_9ACTN|nr:glycerophosphodiester phosphodiesterase family protein [Actinomadura graeca]QXJ26581.1 glycerophosphodiester phosphodiesterase [Actinomadura graeca]
MSRRYGLAFVAVAATTTITGSMTDAAAADPPPAPSSLPAFPEPRPRAVPAAALAAKVANVAHRGASAYAPENTLAAFRLARAQRADAFEIDVQETKDHKLVVLHDSTLTRTTNVETVYPARETSKVSGFTLAQIKRLDAGSWFASKYKGERVPTLGEVLTAMDGRGIGVLVEIKNPAAYPGIENRIATELKRHPSWLRPDPRQRRLAVQSFDWTSVKRFHSALPAVPTALLGTPKVADLPKLAKYADQINPTYGSLTASYVKKVHAARMRLQTWTLDDRTRMRKAVGLGVDGIITNKPDILDDVLVATKSEDV